MVQNDFFPGKSRLRAFAQLKQDKINRSAGFMMYQAQPIGFQIVFCGGCNELCQPFRFVDQEEVATELQKPAAGSEQIIRGTADFLAGQRKTSAGGTFGKIGRIGNTAGKTPGRKNPGYRPQISAYAFHTGSKLIAANVFQRFQMGVFRQFQAGNMTAGILAAQQQTQGAASGTQVQNGSLLWKTHNIRQQNGIGT